MKQTQSDEEREGVRVLQVMSTSPAYGIIFRGDIITKLDQAIHHLILILLKILRVHLNRLIQAT